MNPANQPIETTMKSADPNRSDPMNTTDIPNRTPSATETAPPAGSRNRCWKTAAKVIVLLALVAPFLYSLFVKPPEDSWHSGDKSAAVSAPSRTALFPARPAETTAPTVDWAARKEKIRGQLEECLAAASLEEAAVWRKFAREWAALCRQNEASLDAGVDNAVSTICQADQIGWLVADFARDKIQGGERAKTRIEQCSCGFLEATKESSVRTRELLARLQADLQAVNNRYAAAVGDVVDDAKLKLPASDYRNLATVYQTMPAQISFEVLGSAVAVGVEVVMFKSTMKALVKLLAEVLGPQIAKVAAGFGIAAADGPLPVGDIVGVGLGAWTVYDVVSLPAKISGEVRENFDQARDAQLRQLGGQALSAVRQLRASAAPARRNLFSQLAANL